MVTKSIKLLVTTAMLICFAIFPAKAQDSEFTREQIADSLDYLPLNEGNFWRFYRAKESSPYGWISAEENWKVSTEKLEKNGRKYNLLVRPDWDWFFYTALRNDSLSGKQFMPKSENFDNFFYSDYLSYFSNVGVYWDSNFFKDSLEIPVENFMVSEVSGLPFLEHSARFSLDYNGKSENSAKTYYEGTFYKTDRELLFDNPADTLIKIRQYRVEMEGIWASSQDSVVFRYQFAHRIGLLSFEMINYRTKGKSIDTTFSKLQLYEATIRGKKYIRPDYFVDVGIEKQPEKPSRMQLTAYPNPFNPQTNIRLQMNQARFVKLSAFDILGRTVRILFEGTLSSGLHTFPFEAGSLPSGLYLIRAESDALQQHTKVMLVK